ncbi:MspA family porin [Nocardia sp. NPDC052566]|uniref:MspA family porin n=1 Tax=Nocardia sp. NPDC052566 TaxID=3364330 RepID=UPI0037CBB91C
MCVEIIASDGMSGLLARPADVSIEFQLRALPPHTGSCFTFGHRTNSLQVRGSHIRSAHEKAGEFLMKAKSAMKVKSVVVGSLLGAVLSAWMPTAAHAELVTFAPRERVITTEDGWDVTLRLEPEWTRVAPINLAGTSREGFGSLRASVTVDGKGSRLKGAQVSVGYVIGCFADLNSVTVGFQGSIGPRASIEPGFPLPLVPRGEIGATAGPSFSASVSPGQIKAYPMAQKTLEAADTVLRIRDTHVAVDGCLGPAQVLPYASVSIDSQAGKDGVTVYTDTFFI